MDELIKLLSRAEYWQQTAAAAREAYLSRLRGTAFGNGIIVHLKRQADEAQAHYETALRELGVYVLEHQAELLIAR